MRSNRFPIPFLIVFALFLTIVFAASTTFASAPPYPNAINAVPAPTGVTDLWGGAVESIALRADGTVWTWGWDNFGMLGNGHYVTMTDPSTQYDSWVPFQVLGSNGVGHLTSIQAIAGGERHNTALDTNGEVWTWGWNYFGQLGINANCTGMNTPDCMGTTPVKIPGFTSVKMIASRGYHTLALKNDGTVWAWGYNDSGRLGDGTTTDRHSPTLINGLTGHGKVLSISGGGDMSAALMEDHTVMAWGMNVHGAVGNGTINALGQWTPTTVSQSTGLTYVKAIATGWDHMVALDQNNTVWTWGDNGDGQIGNGITSTEGISLPFHVPNLSNVIGISAGDGSTVVLTADGHVWEWGTLRHGDGSYVFIGDSPVPVAGIDHVTLVRARDWHVLALKSDGTVWAWGSNQRGECGNGTVGGNTDNPGLVLFPTFAQLYLPLVVR